MREPKPTPDAAETTAPGPSAPEQPTTFSRRGLLGAVGAGIGVGLVAGGAAGAAAGAAIAGASGSSTTAGAAAAAVPFFGEHQAGIVTPAQDRLHFASFDLLPGASRDDLIALLQEWTAAAARLARGEDVSESGAVGGPPLAPPDDTGEALGLPASALTITIGFGPSLFVDANGVDRFGIADRRPAALEPLPLFAFDLLEAPISGGDLCIQACANDPQVAVHAIRNLTRIAFGTAMLRWAQLGFGRTSSTSTSQQTPRNLFGYKDGTANIMAEDAEALDEFVWVDPADDPAAGWLAGGSYLVTRRIVMTIETWDRQSLSGQDDIIGRTKGEGGPLSGGGEFTAPDFALRRTDGAPAIPDAAHMRLAHPETTGTRLLRRGYNYVDGANALGQLNAGLFFMSYQRSPEQFATVQRSLATDAMNEYIRHVSSAVFAVPPGVRDADDWFGRALLG
jgi:deferrochelatase/peroxidase EfeB